MKWGWCGVAVTATWLTAASALASSLFVASADKERKAPSIQLKTLDGKSVRLSDRKGRVVLVDFWASWCAPCKATFPALNALAADLKAGGVDVFAVNEDEKRNDLDAFLAGSELSLSVLIDPRGDAAAAFGVTAIPSMYVIDRNGSIKFSHPNYPADVIDSVRAEVVALTGAQDATER